jgi:hypothetical protein
MMKNNIKIDSKVKKDLIDSFEKVKTIVKKEEGFSRAGLMLGLQELGTSINGFIGAYYPVASNVIVMNKTPIRRLLETKPDLLKSYSFHILLHEYIHSLGFLNENLTRQKTYDISEKYFGVDHTITKFSTDIKKFFPNLIYPINGWMPPNINSEIELIKGFDKTNYEFYIS